MNASQPWRNRRRIIEMCLDLAVAAQAQDQKPEHDDGRIADEMAARIFAMAEMCSCMGWANASQKLREAHAELLKETEKQR